MSRRGAGVAFCIFGTLITPGLLGFHEVGFAGLTLAGPVGLGVGPLFVIAGLIYLLRAEASEARERRE